MTSLAHPTTTADARPSRPRWLWCVLAAGLALVGVDLFATGTEVGAWSFVLVSAGSALVALLGARRNPEARVPRLVALGVALSALGDLGWQLFVWVRGTGPDVSVADLGWLGSYVAIGLALFALVRTGTDRWLDREAWIDAGVVFVIALLLQWQLVLDDIVRDTSVGSLPTLVWSLYPALDVALLALVVRAVVGRRVHGAAGALLAVGTMAWLVSDTGWAFLSGSAAAWLDAGWLLGAMALAAVTWCPTADDRVRERDLAARDTADLVGPWRIGVGLVGILVPSTIEIVGHVAGHDPNPVPLFAATLALVLLAFGRAALLRQAGRTTRERLRSHERRAKLLADMASDAWAIVDADGRVQGDSPRLASMVGYDGFPTDGEFVFETVHPEDVESALAVFARAVQEPGVILQTEVRATHRDGHPMWIGVRLIGLLHDADVGGVLVNMHDISGRKHAEEALEHQAFHDGLTGLPNRALFSDRVDHALRRSERTGHHPAVLYLDLDGFKNVNDTLGHAAGDDLLRTVAGRLSDAVRSGESIARLGGDEFAVLIEPSRRPVADAEVVAERILQALADPIEVADQLVTISGSIGIAGADALSTTGSLLRDADVAMYNAKTEGKSRWVVYDADMRVALVEHLQLANDLGNAVEAGQLRLVYQPVIELESDRVVGFEALLRWHHPVLGVVAPDRFIPLAEDSGLIVPIGAWVLQESCATASRWAQQYPDQNLTMAVNVSARQLASSELLDDVIEALACSGLEPHRLVLEMTETALVHDATVAARRLHELRRLGVRLAIDDFGTGYSSLSYLRQFPVDILKIDRSFVESITSREQVPAIVRGLLDLGRTLELEMIAEGVELEVQRDRLRAEHCGLAQGFLFAKPLDLDDAEVLLLHVAAGSEVRAASGPRTR